MSESPAEPTGNDEAPSRPTRRQLIAGIAALVAGAAGSSPQEAEAANGEAIFMGQTNDTNQTTQLNSFAYTSGLPATPSSAVFQVSGVPSGGTRPAIFGQSGLGATTGTVTLTAAVGVVGLGRTGMVAGAGQTRVSEVRPIANQAGLFDAGAVVFNDDDISTGLLAYQGPGFLNVPVTITAQPAAVHGLTFRQESVAGVFEHGNNGTAILALGDVEVFGRISATEGGAGPSACGRATILAGATQVEVSNAAVTANSIVSVTLLNAAGRKDAPIVVSHVRVFPGVFRVVLTGLALRNTPVAWLVFDC